MAEKKPRGLEGHLKDGFVSEPMSAPEAVKKDATKKKRK